MLILTANFSVSIENLKQTNKVLSENVFQSDLFYIFSKGCPNEHISNIIDFTDELEIPNWNVDCQYNSGISSCSNWYCWNIGLPVGSIQTELVGNGRGRLDFGNCWETGIVRVLLNGTEIASASANTPSITIEFDFTNREALKLVEESIGIIQFNQFEVLSCTSD